MPSYSRLPSSAFRRGGRTGIAYLSNMAVVANWQRRGVARLLLREAEVLARLWACRTIALHCDKHSEGAIALYLREGYRIVDPPAGATWPEPAALEGMELKLMMKTLLVRTPGGGDGASQPS